MFLSKCDSRPLDDEIAVNHGYECEDTVQIGEFDVDSHLVDQGSIHRSQAVERGVGHRAAFKHSEHCLFLAATGVNTHPTIWDKFAKMIWPGDQRGT